MIVGLGRELVAEEPASLLRVLILGGGVIRAGGFAEVMRVGMSATGGGAGGATGGPCRSAAQLVVAKNVQPVRSVDEMAADVFESDEELEAFLAFTYAERRRGFWPDSFLSGPASA